MDASESGDGKRRSWLLSLFLLIILLLGIANLVRLHRAGQGAASRPRRQATAAGSAANPIPADPTKLVRLEEAHRRIEEFGAQSLEQRKKLEDAHAKEKNYQKRKDLEVEMLEDRNRDLKEVERILKEQIEGKG